MKFTPEQEATLIEKNLLQTAEAVLFASDVISGLNKATEDDDHLSWFEIGTLSISLRKEAATAFKGLKDMPAEWCVLEPHEVELLGDILYPAFANSPSYKRDRVNACLGWLVNTVNVINTFKAPKAHPVPE